MKLCSGDVLSSSLVEHVAYKSPHVPRLRRDDGSYRNGNKVHRQEESVKAVQDGINALHEKSSRSFDPGCQKARKHLRVSGCLVWEAHHQETWHTWL